MAKRRTDPPPDAGEAARLWRDVTRDTVPLKGRRPRIEPPPPAQPAAVSTPARPPPIRRPVPTPMPAPPPVAAEPGPGLDKRTAERLRRGQLPIEASLDLHGMTQDQAHRALDRFMADQYNRGRRVLLLITGRGFKTGARTPEESMGVLRRMVPRWLKEAPHRARVLSTASAQPKDGGVGALYVLLRRERGGRP